MPSIMQPTSIATITTNASYALRSRHGLPHPNGSCSFLPVENEGGGGLKNDRDVVHQCREDVGRRRHGRLAHFEVVPNARLVLR